MKVRRLWGVGDEKKHAGYRCWCWLVLTEFCDCKEKTDGITRSLYAVELNLQPSLHDHALSSSVTRLAPDLDVYASL